VVVNVSKRKEKFDVPEFFDIAHCVVCRFEEVILWTKVVPESDGWGGEAA
jgi:hypothetical protein